MNRAWVGVVRIVATSALVGGTLAAAQMVAGEIVLPQGGAAVANVPGALRAAPTMTTVSCPGPELIGLKGAPDSPQQVTVVAGRAPLAALPSSSTAQGRITVSAGDSSTPSSSLQQAVGVTRAAAVTVTGTDALAPGLAASQSWTSDTKDLRGLTTTACPADGDDLWLLGGGGAPGRQERLILANSGANEVTVDVVVHGLKGVVQAPNGRGIVVPARARTSILLDAIAAGEAAPAVHVTVRGGTVSAVLSDVWLDGSVPAGADTSTPVTPNQRQVIPGVDLAQAGVLRVGVPGDTQAVISVKVVTTEGAAPLPGGGVSRVAAGSTLDIPLTDLPAGVYAVVAVADVPIVASAFSQARAGSAHGDFAWSAAAPAVTGLAGVPLGALSAPSARTLMLTATDGEARATVWTGDPSAPQKQTITVGADRNVAVSLPTTAGAVWVESSGGAGELRAAVVSSTGTAAERLLSVMTLADSVTTTSIQRTIPLP